MTRKEAIHVLNNTSFFNRETDDFDAAIGVAIEALEDIIEMSVAIDTITYSEGYTYGFDNELNKSLKWIEREGE